MDPQIVSIAYIVGLFALLYFLFIRPQQKRQKQHQQMINNLEVNDEITTVGGILGTIVKIKEESVVLRIADGVRVEFLKNAVGQIRNKANEEKE